MLAGNHGMEVAGIQPALAGEAVNFSGLYADMGRLALPQYYSAAAEGAALQNAGAADDSSQEAPGLLVARNTASTLLPRLAVRKTVEQLAAEAVEKYGPAKLTPANERDADRDRRDGQRIQSVAQRLKADQN